MMFNTNLKLFSIAAIVAVICIVAIAQAKWADSIVPGVTWQPFEKSKHNSTNGSKPHNCTQSIHTNSTHAYELNSTSTTPHVDIHRTSSIFAHNKPRL
jgi:hypothetical protein